MHTAANLRAEVFIDEYDDGSVKARATLLRVDDRRIFGEGSATFVSRDVSSAGIDDQVIAAWALFDLTQKLIGDTSSPDRPGRYSFAGTIVSDGATLAVGRSIEDASTGEEGDSAAMPGAIHRNVVRRDLGRC
jgi:uncharacterized protein DUF1876